MLGNFFTDAVFNWIFHNYLELAGSFLGIVYVILATKQNIWCWYAGFVNVALYIFIFIDAKLYGDMALQVFYLVMSIYGWYQWKFARTDLNMKIAVSHIKTKLLLWVIFITSAMAVIFGYLLTFTDTDVPRLDGIVTALGLTGTWMTARKYIENWLVWIIANTLCIAIYFYKDLYPTLVFYFIITVLAVIGYYQWKKELKKIKSSELQ